MTIFEIIIFIIIITITVLLSVLAISTLQLIKELKNSLSKINRMLDNSQPFPREPLKKLEEAITFTSPLKSSSSRHLFHRQKTT